MKHLSLGIILLILLHLPVGASGACLYIHPQEAAAQVKPLPYKIPFRHLSPLPSRPMQTASTIPGPFRELQTMPTMKFGYTTAGAHWFFTRRLTTINGLDDQIKAAWAQRICQRGPTFLCFAGKICCTKAASI